jgi:hypothetical protein
MKTLMRGLKLTFDGLLYSSLLLFSIVFLCALRVLRG